LARKPDYNNWSKKDIIKRIEALENRKKYGLVWDKEREPEKVVLECKEKLPVLKEVKTKEIRTNPSKTTHILIEGDNYHALSVLNYTHEKSIDVIYIDPPYNTGNKDFIFNDKYVDSEDGYRHSKWLSFMEKRLQLAKELLKNTGVIFISIDDNEMARLKVLCDAVFLEKNFVQNFMWLHGKGKKDRWSRTLQQYILCYAKNRNKLPPWTILSYANYKFENTDNDPRGGWFSGSVSFSEKRSNKQHPNYFEIKSPSGIVWKRQWQRSSEEMEELLKQNKIYFGLPPQYDKVPRVKIFPDDIDEQIPPNIIDNVGSTREAQKRLDEMFGKRVFDYPKPVSLMNHIINLSSRKGGIILDFMAGTGTTGHAVLGMNKEAADNRQFILCTNNENNICTEVCYPRIKKVIKGYTDLRERKVGGLGGNLKYFKTDFVPASPTDRNKEKLTKQSVEMLCLRENTFDLVSETETIKIFQNHQKYTGILFDQLEIPKFKKMIKKFEKSVSVYVFSLSDDDFAEEFEDMKDKVKVCSIPEAILRVYRRIFK